MIATKYAGLLLAVLVLASVLVAFTVIVWLVAVSASRTPATVTTPLAVSILNKPPALSVRAYSP